MPVRRYRSVAEMPPPWREPDDPANLRAVATMIGLHRELTGGGTVRRGVRRFRTIQEANAERDDPYRREDPRLAEKSDRST